MKTETVAPGNPRKSKEQIFFLAANCGAVMLHDSRKEVLNTLITVVIDAVKLKHCVSRVPRETRGWWVNISK